MLKSFAGHDCISPAVTFDNLTGEAVGEIHGESAAATISLDTDAASHDWFIDYMPYLDEDFLPTCNPR